MSEAFRHLMKIGQRIHHQVSDRKAPNRVYSIHEPEVACIVNSKIRKPLEFASKVSIATTVKSSRIVGGETFSGNPYDGSTLKQAVAGVPASTGASVTHVIVDNGYRGIKRWPDEVKVAIAGRKSLKPSLTKLLKRRQAVEPIIGHLKADHRMNRCFLKGPEGEALNALLAAVGFNFRKWLQAARQRLRSFLYLLLTEILALQPLALRSPQPFQTH